jgi:thiamine-monophosphate kinase
MTLFGRRERNSRWLLRSNARVGDTLFIGGVLGRAVAGLRLVGLGARLEGNAIRLPEALSEQPTSVIAEARRAVRAYLLPQPQVALGLRLARLPRAAAIDISDGLSLDLARLCRESGVGAGISLEALLPTTTPLAHLHRAIGIDSESAILAGGDEYRLLFSLPAGLRVPEELGCVEIGTISKGPKIRLIEAGRSRPLHPEGFDHFIADRSTEQ